MTARPTAPTSPLTAAGQSLAGASCSRLPEWLEDLRPDRKTWTGESTCCEWLKRGIILDVYEDGDVVAMAPCEEEKTGYCEVPITDQEWLTNFVDHGWADTNPSFTENAQVEARQ